jgi:hypothetical protein
MACARVAAGRALYPSAVTQPPEDGFEGVPHLLGGAVDGLLQSRRLIAHRDRLTALTAIG